MRNWILAGITIVLIIAVLAVLRFGGDRRLADGPEQSGRGAIEETTAPQEDPARQPAQDGLIKPSFDVVRITRDGKGVIAGRAADNAEVTILTGEEIIGTEMANNAGEWVLIIDERPLQPGAHELSLSAVVGNGSRVQSENVLIIHIPDPADGGVEQSEILAVLTPKSGDAPSRVLQRPGSPLDRRADRQIALDSIDYDANGRMNLSGRLPPNGTAHLYIDNSYLTTVKANAEGFWSWRGDGSSVGDEHVLRIDQVNAESTAEDVELRVEYRFSGIDEGRPSIGEGSVVVVRGNNLWQIARQMYGTGFRYTLIFEANASQIRDPDLIYPNQQFVLPGNNN